MKLLTKKIIIITFIYLVSKDPSGISQCVRVKRNALDSAAISLIIIFLERFQLMALSQSLLLSGILHSK
jgi:hypothetical protein